MPPTPEDALQFLIGYLREGARADDGHPYGYGFYLPNVMRRYLRGPGADRPGNDAIREVSPQFYAAAWELCRRGIIRPGLREYGLQATEDGASGNGYTVTPQGAEWLREARHGDATPNEPLRFVRMLADAGHRFGAGFLERSQEGVRAYNALAYLACCAMCGAAAESIVLRLAIEQRGDEAAVIRDYETAGGRGRLEAALIRNLHPRMQAEFRRYTDLLKYWRDSAAHGQASNISEAEAYTSLLLLLRFALLAAEHFGEMTGR